MRNKEQIMELVIPTGTRHTSRHSDTPACLDLFVVDFLHTECVYSHANNGFQPYVYKPLTAFGVVIKCATIEVESYRKLM